jgi:hypothetical protein
MILSFSQAPSTASGPPPSRMEAVAAHEAKVQPDDTDLIIKLTAPH